MEEAVGQGVGLLKEDGAQREQVVCRERLVEDLVLIAPGLAVDGDDAASQQAFEDIESIEASPVEQIVVREHGVEALWVCQDGQEVEAGPEANRSNPASCVTVV